MEMLLEPSFRALRVITKPQTRRRLRHRWLCQLHGLHFEMGPQNDSHWIRSPSPSSSPSPSNQLTSRKPELARITILVLSAFEVSRYKPRLSLQLKSRCWSHNNAERTKWNWSVKDGLDDNGIEMDRNRDLELELKL
ncbi:GM11853 [Drosophila sechellia]|uniref:GM11853 n=1 Tax=Drosophila sechellia TaxID=7238 RepID=B4IHE7_DROSE|nr:GM11853 [Drosophila sechellia]